jgi:hypothetical protein
MSMKIISSGLEQYPQTRRSVCGRMVLGVTWTRTPGEGQDRYLLSPPRPGPATQNSLFTCHKDENTPKAASSKGRGRTRGLPQT